MSRFSRNRRPSPSRYLIEFLIIIAGIMVSFLLNEWREDNRLAEKKVALVKEIQQDLKIDSAMMYRSIKYYKMMLRGHDSLLINRNSTFDEDSLSFFLDYVTSYIPVNETKSTYQKMISNQELTLNEEDTLLEDFLSLHNYLYPQYHEWTYIEKEFVLKQVLPYMDLNAPFIYNPNVRTSFDGKVFYQLREKDAFMNYIKSGKVYKSAITQMSELVFENIKKQQSNIRTVLNQIEEE